MTRVRSDMPSSRPRRSTPTSPPRRSARSMSPLDRLTPLMAKADEPRHAAAHLTRGARVAPGAGGRGYLPRSWTGVASSQCRPCEPRPAEGDVGDRELPHDGARRACRALREVRAHHSSPTTPVATGIARSARGRRRRSGWPSARPSCCRCRTSTSCSPCRRASPTSPTRTRP